MRSKLFVPGSRPELFAKALASAADAISFDLEDAVPERSKAPARTALAAFLRSEPARASSKTLIVRVNGIRSPHFAADVEAVAGSIVALINLPKVGGAQDVRDAARSLDDVERRHGRALPLPLLINIETPAALRQAAAIADAHERVVGLQLGLVDLFEPLGIDRTDPANTHAARFALRMAAGETGRFALDSAFPDVHDQAGLEREAHQAQRLGYLGKSCIHPAQIAIANRVFDRAGVDIAAARRIVAAADDAARAGRGAFLLDGRMVDLPLISRARMMLAQAPEAATPP